MPRLLPDWAGTTRMQQNQLGRLPPGFIARSRGVRITEVLADVDAWTGFTDCFTHLRTDNPAGDKPALLEAVLADGTNLGLSR
jgi:hypothetical protein